MGGFIKLTKKAHKALDKHFKLSVQRKKEFEPIPAGMKRADFDKLQKSNYVKETHHPRLQDTENKFKSKK